ncbi:glycogen synthase [[Mycoplasma] testudinis]|uniref:glycogen synthase n=1 Tax=[Mycoplasma] testudinis TaxID=33924 RepID=UPI000487BA2A|nr:glycogen/starch synthase [[Mycoplasma] testudinis]
MRIWYISAECYPFIKTGGLGDVSYAFPRALTKIGVEVSVILPFFYSIPEKYTSQMTDYLQWSVQLEHQDYQVIVKKLRYHSVDYYFVATKENPINQLTSSYSNFTNAFDFALFSKAVVKFLEVEQSKPNIIHLNDWHTGLIPLMLKLSGNGELNKIKTVFTIHNLQYQGQFGADHVLKLFNWSKTKSVIQEAITADVFSFMRSGIVFSDAVTTVSPTYMLEIQSCELGMGLDTLLLKNSNKLTGILNGLDTEIYNPESDELIFTNFTKDNWKINKAVNKKHLQEKTGLEVNPNKFLIGIVSRLVNQKGFDIFDMALPILQKHNPNIQFVILGTGDKLYEMNLKRVCSYFDKPCRFINEFNEKYAHEIYAGADAFLIPSYFEPCGLTQLIALAYGTVPIVRKTGGLADTVFDYKLPNGNGFLFEDFNVNSLVAAVQEAHNVFDNDRQTWERLVNEGMQSKFSWVDIAKQYLELYKKNVA